ncbi:MAG: M48 family metalloprotease [Alphaproteobacteria bacterium]|nr:M48 family metalloprotease [Alphaproteobacteria bacterium]
MSRFLVLTVLATSIVRPATAQNLSLISDAETERMIRNFAEPVFAAAGLTTDSVSVHIVNDRALNAFVAGGQRIFLFTGLLVEAEHPRQIIGVLAHETGHISGGHLARTQEALRSANAIAIVAAVLGVAAAAVGGGGAAGAAVFGGGAQVAGQSVLQYSRVQESAADQAAMRYLNDTGQSARGLVEVLEKLGDQEALLRRSQSSYGRTHPLSRDRILALEKMISRSPSADVPDPPDQIAAFDRVRAKVLAFLDPKKALRQYPESDTSVPARYARAIAYHRTTEPKRAIAEIDSLIANFPNDPFFHELKGQIIYENGGRGAAIPPNAEAVRLAPHEPLLRLGLGQALVAMNDPALDQEAIIHLEEAVRIDREMVGAWGQLAIAYGRAQQFGLSSLASAEQAIHAGRLDDARGHAARAERLLPAGSPGQLRAQDILSAAKPRR